MCLRLASGMAEWMGRKVRPADVVYLAGEGHHGLRGRIAAWKHYHGCKLLSMWLSRAGVDLNTPEGFVKALQQIRKLPRKPRLIIVDTLHRFLAGDENSAQDAKTMLDACAALMREFECSVLLVHHTGVSEEAQHRARGSSAWRGALDIEISVVPAKDGQPLQIVQRKSKDAELAQPIYASLQQVTIPGWVDEDGDPVTSAVITAVTAPVTAPSKAGSKLDQHRRMFERAWWDSGAELRDGAPYVSRSAMLDYLTTKAGLGEASAKLYVKPAATGKLISSLLDARTIEATGYGWRVIDPTHAASMVLQKASGGVG
jgi:putative DNA primase/helicase